MTRCRHQEKPTYSGSSPSPWAAWPPASRRRRPKPDAAGGRKDRYSAASAGCWTGIIR